MLANYGASLYMYIHYTFFHRPPLTSLAAQAANTTRATTQLPSSMPPKAATTSTSHPWKVKVPYMCSSFRCLLADERTVPISAGNTMPPSAEAAAQDTTAGPTQAAATSKDTTVGPDQATGPQANDAGHSPGEVASQQSAQETVQDPADCAALVGSPVQAKGKVKRAVGQRVGRLRDKVAQKICGDIFEDENFRYGGVRNVTQCGA
jgi:hypothetical protein